MFKGVYDNTKEINNAVKANLELKLAINILGSISTCFFFFDFISKDFLHNLVM